MIQMTKQQAWENILKAMQEYINLSDDEGIKFSLEGFDYEVTTAKEMKLSMLETGHIEL
jgi:hypothetical protein